MARVFSRGGAREGGAAISHDAPTSGNISLFDEEGGNEYAQMVESGHRIDPRAQRIFVTCVVLAALYVFALFIPKDLINSAFHNGGWNNGYSFSWFVNDLSSNVNGVIAALTGNDEGVYYSSTMFRYVMVALSGAGLALCGAIYQGSFRNALVSPSSMGVMSGASVGMLVWVMFYVNDEATNVPWLHNVVSGLSQATSQGGDIGEYLWSSYSYSVFSFLGCMAVAGTVLLVMALSKKNSTSGLMVIIMGQVFGGIFSAISTAVRYYLTENPDYEAKLEVLNAISVGSFFRDYTFIDVLAVGIPVLICVLVVMRFNQRLMVLSFGNEEARSLGVDSKRTQLIVIAVSTLLVAVIISFCGAIGFVGFLVPHLARRMVGPNFRYLLPASMALGAVFVLTAFLLVAMLLGPDYETMSGMFISIGGAIVFLVQALRGTTRRGGDLRGFTR